MKLCQHQKALVDFSYTDTLTGLADRRYSQSILTRECHSAVRGEHPLSIALLEINDFKHYIERFGDQQGDAYLAHVAKIFNDRLRRQNDLLARFADDDFLLILPHTDYQGAQVAVNNLLQALPQQQLSSNALGNSDNISINVGIASYSPHLICDDEPSAAWLLDEADQQLFAAKKKLNANS